MVAANVAALRCFMQDNELDQAAVRTWLKEMPDASFFKDDVWLACDKDGEWYIFNSEPMKRELSWDVVFSHDHTELDSDFFNLPILEGDQWKYSCISAIELAEWQMSNERV